VKQRETLSCLAKAHYPPSDRCFTESERHTNSLPSRGAHGNGYEATRTNASGERASTLWLAGVIGQVLSLKEEPPGIYPGECQNSAQETKGEE
jgi:hypothetical protein